MLSAYALGSSLPRFSILGTEKGYYHTWIPISIPPTRSYSLCFFSIQGAVIYSSLTLAFIWTVKRLFTRARIRWYHADSTVKFNNKNGTQLELSQLCKLITPHCFLNPLLSNSHLQTLFSMLDNRPFRLFFRRKIFESQSKEFPGSFAVDFKADPFVAVNAKLPPRTAYYDGETESQLGSDDSKPMLIILHGLCGGSHEKYLQHVLEPLVNGGQKWEACVVLSRGCGQSDITGGGMYYAHATSDMRQVVHWLQKLYPNRPLYGAGFSMGANIMTRYVAEQGNDCVLKAAIVLSNPWNLETTMLHLQRSFWGRWLYSPRMTANLMEIFSRNADKIETTAGEKLELGDSCNVHLMHEYDQLIQCPTWGFPTERVYYRQASSSDSVLDIRIPFWAINSEDDPIIGYESLPKGEFHATPYTVMTTTDGGGHLGWFQLDGRRWYARAMVSFYQKMHIMGHPEAVVPNKMD